MGRLEHRHAIADVGARRDADPADLRGNRVRQVIAIQVHGGEHVEFLRAQQHELENDVGDAVLDQDLAFGDLAAMLSRTPRSR